MAFKILGANVSPFVRKTRTFCIEKGIPCTLEMVNPAAPPPGWREKSPLGKIPVLDHDGRIVNDSSIICAYLERLHPEPALYPRDAYDCARAAWIEEFVDGGVVPIAGPAVFRPLALMPVLTQKAPDAAAIAAAEKVVREELAPLFAYLESQLGAGDYFVGNRLSIADLTVASVFVNLRHAGYPPDRAKLPKLAAFVERMHGRPSFKSCIEEERPLFGKRWV
ncbi:MAG TPA: glutathione S-transferase family protein [Myxococcota bacterium]|nr:glutathione S-transferase family protein [Myxococcota bacterium]